ncbi:MAG: hypothetical protein ACFFFC_04715 [Candidatus Thorarchaeota archaeon]
MTHDHTALYQNHGKMKNIRNALEENKRMISEKMATTLAEVVVTEEGRAVNPFTDSELIRLTAINLELAVKNLIASSTPPECIVITAELCTHRLVAKPTPSGEIEVRVFE